jgi:carbonic anhydrase/acetyltransferase-like protein (isoleucine patch superfamily)
MKKFELTAEFVTNVFGKKLFRIKALVAFGNVEKGELGGFIENEDNLSHAGDAWVFGDAQVFGNAQVSGDARVFGDAWVSGDARVFGDAWVFGDAQVFGNARVFGDAQVSGDAQVFGDAWVFGDARVFGNARVFGDAQVLGDAQVSGNARVFGNAQVSGDAQVFGDAWVSGDARVSGNADYAVVTGFGRYFRATTFFRCKDKILRIQCGCFYGDLARFREIVKKTHGDSKYAKEYLAIADLMELHFSDECGGEQ